MTRAVLIAAMVTAVSTATDAQVRVVRSGDDRLAVVSAVDVLLLHTEADSRCAVTIPAMQALAVGALREAGLPATLSETAPSDAYSVVIDIGSASREDLCAATVTTELVAQVDGLPHGDKSRPGQWGSILVGYMPLIHLRTLVIGPALEHDAAVRRAVHAQLEAVTAKLRSVNVRQP
jgi:hypothetical protein